MNTLLAKSNSVFNISESVLALADQLIDTFADKGYLFTAIDGLRGVKDQSDILKLQFHNTNLKQDFLVMINDQSKEISFAIGAGSFGHAINYSKVDIICMALASAFTVNELFLHHVNSTSIDPYYFFEVVDGEAVNEKFENSLASALREFLSVCNSLDHSHAHGAFLKKTANYNKFRSNIALLAFEYLPNDEKLVISGNLSLDGHAVITAVLANFEKLPTVEYI